MDYRPDSVDALLHDEGTMYSWYIAINGIYYDIHQENNGQLLILVKNKEGDLEEAILGMNNADWLKSNNIVLLTL